MERLLWALLTVFCWCGSIANAELLPVPCRSGISDLAGVKRSEEFSLKLIDLPTGWSVILKRTPARGKVAMRTQEKERVRFLNLLAEIYRLQVKGTCPAENFDVVFVYPGISYSISSQQLAAIHKFKVNSALWRDQVIMRLTVARI